MNIAIITSRWESKRLPGKALIDICDKPLLRHIIDNARKSKLDDTVVATTPSSSPIIQYCKENYISYFVGDEEDILSRLFRAAVNFNADRIIRLWGDNPLITSEAIDFLVDQYDWTEPDYLYMSDMPMAMMSFDFLAKLHKEVANPNDRHWIHVYIMKGDFIVTQINRGFKNISVDTEEDLEAVRRILCKSEM